MTMHRLPLDVLNEVLDLIFCVKTLAALCRTSKHLYGVTTCRLYGDLTIDLRSTNDASRSYYLLYARARKQIATYTRHVTFVACPLPPCAVSLRNSPHNPQRIPTSPNSKQVDLVINMYLGSIPDSQLRSFRLFSMSPISPPILTFLSISQKSLEYFQAPLPNHELPRNDYNCLQKLNTLNISSESGTRLLNVINSGFISSDLTELHLGAPNYQRSLSKLSVRQGKPLFPKLKKITLLRFDLRAAFQSFLSILNTAHLRELILWGCIGAEGIIAQIGELNNTGDVTGGGCSIERLVVSFISPPENFNNSLASIDKRGNIRSLHILLEYRKLQPFPLTYLPKHLESFSFHNRAREADALIPMSSLGLPYLKQFGAQLGKLQLSASRISMDWKFLSELPSLQVLHIRIDFKISDEYLVENAMHYFVESLFGHLERNKWCPNLKVVIIGMWRLTAVSPRICFVKGQTTHPIKGQIAIAHIISEYQLSEIGQDMGILEFDPGECWANGTPGQNGELRTLYA